MSSYRRVKRPIILDSSESESGESESLHDEELEDSGELLAKPSGSSQQEPILLDSSDEDDNPIDIGIECGMQSLNLGGGRGRGRGRGRGLAGKRKPLKSQLAALNFDSSSDESQEDQEQDQGNRNGKQGDLCKSKARIPRKKSNRGVSTIELLDTDTDSSGHGNNDSNSEHNISYSESIPSDSSVSDADAASILISPRASPEVFKMKTPSPSNSALSFTPPREKEYANEYASQSSSCSTDSQDVQSLDGKDESGSAWRRNKHGVYVLKGKCLINGDFPWPKIYIPAKLYDKLYDHQKIGVQWLASLYSKGIGGILGDDMGLGKLTNVHD